MGINILPLPIQNFIHRKLEEKEEAINKLHADGDQLLAQNHPGKNAIEVSTRDGSQLPTHPGAWGDLPSPSPEWDPVPAPLVTLVPEMPRGKKPPSPADV